MIITVVISMLLIMSYHIFIAAGCSKSQKKQSDGSRSPSQTLGAGSHAGSNAPTPTAGSRAGTTIDREEGDSVRTKVGNKNGSKEPDSTDDAFKSLAARLAKKENPDKTADSLFGDDDENPIAAFQMPERPVVDGSKDKANLAHIVEMEKKPIPPPAPPKQKQRGVTPQGLSIAPPLTAKERSVAEDAPKSKKSKNSKMSRASNKKSRASRMEDVIATEPTQSDHKDPPPGKPPADIEKTQNVSVDDGDVAKTQRHSIRTIGSASMKMFKKKDRIFQKSKQ